MPSHLIRGALIGMLAGLAACTSTPEVAEKEVVIGYDPDTGEFSVPDGATSDEKAIAGLLNEFKKSEVNPPPVQQLTEAEIWKSDGAGNMTHIQSGLLCPSAWAGLKRDSATVYNYAGQDVGCNYTDTFGAIVTFYAYRSAGPASDEVAGIMDQVVRSRHPVHEEAVIDILETPTYRGDFATDAIRFKNAQDTEIISGVAVNEYVNWRLKVRFTYPAAEAERVEAFLMAAIMGQQDALLAVAKAADAALERDDTI